VDDFVAGAWKFQPTTNISTSLVHPKLAPEYFTARRLDLSELGTSGSATSSLARIGATSGQRGVPNFWKQYGPKRTSARIKPITNVENAREWFRSGNLEQADRAARLRRSSEFDGNAYGKGGWVLYMLRHQIGEDAFNRASNTIWK